MRRIEALDGPLNAFIEVDGERALADAERVVAGRAPFAGVPIAIKGNVGVEGMDAERRLQAPGGQPRRPFRLPRAAAARGRVRDRRHHQPARVRDPPDHRAALHRADAQPVEPRPHARRVLRRLGGGRRRGHGPDRPRQRRRRVDPHPGRVLWAGRPEAQPRADLGRPGPGRVLSGLPRRAHPHRGRHRPRARHPRRLRGRRRELGAAPRRALRDFDAARSRPAADRGHRRQPARRRRRPRTRIEGLRGAAELFCGARPRCRRGRARVPVRAGAGRSSSTSSGRRSRWGSTPPRGSSGTSPSEDEIEPLSRAILERARADALDLLHGRDRPAAGARPRPRGVLRRLRRARSRPPWASARCRSASATGWAPTRCADLARSGRFTPYTSLFNITGQPAISVPIGLGTDGLPAGVQIVGKPLNEEVLLQLAAQLETAHPWAHLTTSAIRRGVTPSDLAPLGAGRAEHLHRQQLRLVPGQQGGGARERLLGAAARRAVRRAGSAACAGGGPRRRGRA